MQVKRKKVALWLSPQSPERTQKGVMDRENG